MRSVLAEDVEQVGWGKDGDESSNGDSETEEEGEPQPKKPKVANEKKRCYNCNGRETGSPTGPHRDPGRGGDPNFP